MTASEVKRIAVLLQQADLPTQPPEDMNAAQFTRLMAVDKKVVDGGLRLVLLKSIGSAVVTGDFETRLLNETLSVA